MNSNDPDSPLPFIQLSALVANVMEFLKVAHEQKEQGNADACSGYANQADGDRDSEKVNQRLSDWVTLERRVK